MEWLSYAVKSLYNEIFITLTMIKHNFPPVARKPTSIKHKSPAPLTNRIKNTNTKPHLERTKNTK